MSISAAQLAELQAGYAASTAMNQAQIENQKAEIEQRYKLGKAQIAGSYREAQLRSKDVRAGIEETREWHRGTLEQARQDMERIGIPEMEIKRYTAEKAYEIAVGELAYKREALAEEARQYEKTYGLQQGELTGMFNGQETLEAQELRRRYGLDVAKYGSELASQPDRYFQARKFQAFDAPRLLGQDTSGAGGPGGAPVPQMQTMGSLLSGQDPAAAGANVYGGPQGQAPAGQPEDERFKQIAQIAKASPPSPYDGLDDSDAATLRLMQSVYQKGFNQIPRGELERMSPSSLGIVKSAGSLLGFDPDEEIRKYQSYAPSQGASNLA